MDQEEHFSQVRFYKHFYIYIYMEWKKKDERLHVLSPPEFGSPGCHEERSTSTSLITIAPSPAHLQDPVL